MKPEEVFCGYCGKKNRSSYSFCTACGKSVEKLEENVAGDTQKERLDSNVEDSKKKKKNRGQGIGLIIGAVLLFAFFYLPDDAVNFLVPFFLMLVVLMALLSKVGGTNLGRGFRWGRGFLAASVFLILFFVVYILSSWVEN